MRQKTKSFPARAIEKKEGPMSIKISGYSFDGRYLTTDSIEDRFGVYAILCKKDEEYYVIDVGESAEVKSRLDNHDRKDCWKEENVKEH